MSFELTPEQRQAIDEQHGQPVFIIDAERQQTFVLLSHSDYLQVRPLLEHRETVKSPEDWSEEKDLRRCELIDKDIAGEISPAERVELAVLEQMANEYFDLIAPPPLEGAKRLHQQLQERRDSQQ